MKFINIILTVLLLFGLLIPVYSASFYYDDDMTAGGLWTDTFYYAQEGVNYQLGGEDNDQRSIFTRNAQGLLVEGRPNDHVSGVDNGVWMGRTALSLSLSNITATKTKPFGIEVIRTHAAMDYAGENWTGPNGAMRDRCAVGFWMYQDDGSIVIANNTVLRGNGSSEEYKIYPNHIYYYELISYEFFNNAVYDHNYARYGFFDGNYRHFTPGELSGSNIGPRETGYDFTGGGSGNLIGFFNYGGYEDDTDNANLNYTARNMNTAVGYKMIHNGSKVSYYMNPNPIDGDGDNEGAPNEYFLIAEKNVDWSNQIRIMVGHSARRSDTEVQRIMFRQIRAVSAADVSAGDIQPKSLALSSSTQTVTLLLTNQIGSTNSGINYITVNKPSVLKWSDVITNAVRVRNHYGNNITQQTLTTVSFQTSTGGFPGANEVAIKTNGDQLILLLGSQIIDQTESENIWIDMNIIVTNIFSTVEFSSYIEAKGFEGMTDTLRSNTSTCGPQLVVSGTNTRISIALGPARGYASISPTSDYGGQNKYNFTYYISTEGIVGKQDVAWAAIKIPDIFTNATITNFDSVIMGTNEDSLIKRTNIPALGSGEYIRLDYTGTKIPSPDGLDVITFEVTGNVSIGTGYWRSWVDGVSLSSNSSLETTNNVNYPSIECAIIPEGPSEAYASIDPLAIYQGPNDYSFTYYFSTSGITGKQDITWAAIEIPDEFTNASITNFNSVVMGTNENSWISITTNSALTTRKIILLNYSVNNIASPDGLDVITFKVLGNVSIGTTTWRSWVDGGSGLSGGSSNTFTNVNFPSQDVIVKPKSPAEGFSSVTTPAQIIQGSPSYSITYDIASGDISTEDIKQVAIYIPGVFNVITNSLNSFILTNNSYITITTNSSLTGPGTNIILIDYDAAGTKIFSGGNRDTITFQIDDNSEKGSYKWKCWVDGDKVDGSSLLTTTNAVFLSQYIEVLGAPPNVAGGITKPVNEDPVYLFNTITVNTLEFLIENRAPGSESANKIQKAVIFVPAVFTNIVIQGSTMISNSYIKLNQGAVGNNSTITLYYDAAGTNIGPKTGPTYEKDRLTFITWHDQLANSGTTNITFSAVVDNSNATGFQPLEVTLIINMEIIDPKPVGEVTVTPGDIVYTSDQTNDFTYRIENNAPSGGIFYAWITIPTNYFVLWTNIQSSRITPGDIQLNNNTIFFDYSTNGGNDIIGVNEWDDITFTLVDKWTNIDTPSSVLISSRVGNESRTNDTEDKDIDETRNVYFVPQEARVRSYITNDNLIKTEVSTATLYYVFENYGNPGNVILYAEGEFTNLGGGGDITSITKVTSSFGGLWNTAGKKFSLNNYNLPANQKDVLTIIITDTIADVTYRDIVPKVTVNTSSMVTTDLPAGKTNRVWFKIPPPRALSQIVPNEMFTTSGKRTNYFTYSIYNDGEGNNKIEEAIIYIPAFLTGKVTALSNSWLPDNTYITNYTNRIVINYTNAGNSLNAGSSDIVYLVITNEIAVGEKTNLLFDVKAANNDGNPPISSIGTIAGGSKYVYVIGEPNGFIDTPSPASIESASITNDIVYRIDNPDKGEPFLSLRISIPTNFTIVSGSESGKWASGSGIYAVSNNYIWADYSVNDIDPNGYDEISFKAVDTYSKTNAIIPWRSEVSYNSYYYYISALTGTQDLSINFTPADADGFLTPNQALRTLVTNSFSFIITNEGYGSNYIYNAYISFPPAVLDVTNVTSTRGATIVVSNTTGVIWLQYTPAGNLQAGEKDTVNFKFIDSITNETNITLSCKVDNGLGQVETTSVLGSKVLAFISARIDSYISPGTGIVDTTTTTNIYTYRINNSGALSNYYKAIVHVPSVYNYIVSVNSSRLGATGISGNISSITLNYTNSASLGNGDYDVLTITAVDSLNYGNSNVSWIADASNAVGWAYTINVTGGQSQDVNFQMPTATAQVYITPDEIYTSSVSNKLVYKVYNDGDGSNDLFDIVIFIPSAFTNITKVTSTYLSDQGHISGLGNITAITLDYAADGGLLSTGQTDTITITAYDAQTNISTTSIWTCYVRNISGGIQYKASESAGKSSISDFVGPPTVEVLPPNTLDTTAASNEFTYKINNIGAGGSMPLQSARVYYDTNIITGVSVTGSAAGVITITNNYIQLDYGPLDFGLADTFTIKVFDNYLQGSTNISWPATVNKGNGYKSANVSGTVDVNFQMPSATAEVYITPDEIYTSSVSNKLVYKVYNDGDGSNDLTDIVIFIPSAFTNITKVTSTYLSDQGHISGLGNITAITLDYAADGGLLSTGQTDTITITAYDAQTNISTTSIWTCYVRNISGGIQYKASESAGKSSISDFVGPPTVEVLPPNTLDTTAASNEFTYKINNIGAGGSMPLQSARVYYDTNIITGVSVTGSAAGVITITNNYIQLDYGPLDFGLADTFTIKVFDNYLQGSTNISWPATVNKGNGYKSANVSGSVDVNFQMPLADGSAFIYLPVNISIQANTNKFMYVIKNEGTGSDLINKVVIDIPAGFTSVSSFTSLFITNPANIVTNSNRIELNYFSESTGIPVNTSETLVFYAIDNVSVETQRLWSCRVDNQGGANLQNTLPPVGKSQYIDFIVPEYKLQVHTITPDQIYSTVETNHIFSIELYNNSTENYIDTAKMILPLKLEITNKNQILSSVITNTFITISNNNTIILDYLSADAGGVGLGLTPGDNDVLTLKLYDTITNGIYTNFWDIQAKYDDADDYADANISYLVTNQLDITMPPAESMAKIIPDTVYTEQSNQIFIYTVSNTGTGRNDIVSIQIVVPDIFTNSLTAGDVTSSNTISISYSSVSRKITLNYSNAPLLIGEIDTIAIKAVIAPTNETLDVLWQSYVDNGFGSYAAEEYTNISDSMEVDVEEINTKANVSIYALTNILYPNEKIKKIYSTDVTNVFVYNIVNDSEDADISIVQISIPSNKVDMTNVFIISSAQISTNFIKITNYKIVIDYAGSPFTFDADLNDTITFRAIDNITQGTDSIFWDSEADFGNGFGFKPAKNLGNDADAKIIELIFPGVKAVGELLTTSIDIVTNAGIELRELSYEIRNNGTGNNNIQYALLRLPGVFFSNNVIGASSALIGGVPDVLSYKLNGTNYVQITYENDTVLSAGSSDIITIPIPDFNIDTPASQLKFYCYAGNVPGSITNLTDIDKGEKLSIINPSPFQADAYLEKDSQTLYSLDKTAELTYRIDNRSSSHNIDEVVIAFDFSLFSNVSIASKFTNAIISTTATNFTLTYPVDTFMNTLASGQDYYDYVKLNFMYNINDTNIISLPTVRTMSCQITFDDAASTKKYAAPGVDTQVLQLLYSYWGKIIGTIKPNEIATLTIYNSLSNTITTNFRDISAFYSKVLTGTNTSGEFTIDRLPPGVYDVEFVNTPHYRTYKYLTKIIVSSNVVTNVGLIKLFNAKIRDINEPGYRTITCLDDGISHVDFPIESTNAMEDFFLDIYINPVSAMQKGASFDNDTILLPTDPSQIKVFNFRLLDINNKPMDEIEIHEDKTKKAASAVIVLHYTDTELTNLANGNRGSLAIYYFKENTGEWIKLGGEPGPDPNTILIKVNYLHSYYAIFSSKKGEVVKIYEGLRIWPNPFTPGRGGDTYENCKVSCIFTETVTGFKFVVYDLSGRIIVTKEYMGTYNQCEIYWDGKDDEEYHVKTGVYIFQIETGSQYYRGKVGVLR